MDKVAPGLWVGNQHSAGDTQQLRANSITAVLNVAWDLDIRYRLEDYTGNVDDDDEPLNQIQYEKVGLVDGPGNPPQAMAAAILALHTYMQPRVGLKSDDAAKYPQPVQNVLVHCHSGQSRSVTVAALYLTLTGAYSAYDTALAVVKSKRHLSSNHNVPAKELTAMARSLAALPLALDFDLPSATTGGSASGSGTTPSGSGSGSTSASGSGSSTGGATQPVGGSKSKNTSSGAVVGASIAVALVVTLVAVLVIVRRAPDSPFAQGVSSLCSKLRCCSSGPTSAYSMSTPPEYDF